MFHGLNSTQDQFHQVISKLGNMPLADGYDVEEVGDNFIGRVSFSGGVLLPDGDVVLVPFQRGEIWVYNTWSKTTTMVCSAPEGGLGYWGGVLLPDGDVFFAPCSAKRFALYSPKSKSCRSVGDITNGIGATDFLTGSTLLPNGLVLLIPFSASSAYLYNYKTEEIIKHPQPLSSCIGCQLMPDGRVLIIPRGYQNCVIYDYRTNEFTTSDNVTGHAGSSLLPSGNVLMPFYVFPQCREYNPETNKTSIVGDEVSGSIISGGCAHLGNGSILIAPRNAAMPYIYNPEKSEIIGLSTATGGIDAYNGIISLPDGSVLLTPRAKRQLLRIKPRGITPLPNTTCLSSYLNKF